MTPQKELKEEINQLNTLQTITTVYGEVASAWMKRATDSILRSRDFRGEMNQVFLTVFSAYAREVQELAKKKNIKRGSKITFLAHNGKKVAVLLSASSGFYGQIVNSTFDLFLKDVREQNYEATIIGRQGLGLYTIAEPNRPYTFYDFPDDKVDPKQLLEMIQHLVQYEEIRVYHGKFQNLLTQDPTVFVISADPYATLKEEEKPKRYIFEPTIEQILMYFEKQIFNSVFDQTMRESQLAKYASRLMVMDRAGENIKERTKSVNQQQLRLNHRANNRKQLGQLVSMNLWH